MKLSDFAPQFGTLWAAGATSSTLQYPLLSGTSLSTGRASIASGFPAANFTPPAAGGVYPWGADWNGALRTLSVSAQNYEAGNVPVFSADFASEIGGYADNALVQYGGEYWVSTADGNTTVPGASGASWLSLFNGYATETYVNGTFVPGSPGYEIKPNGKIEQWGTYTTDSSGLITVYFPFTFPNSCDNIGVNEANATGTWTVNTPTLHGVNQAPNASAFIANVRIWDAITTSWKAGSATGYWRAEGH
ncbi:hypothetical protein MKW11_14660 [Gluconobacter frateurii]|uniref:gp53-like domain-containing protein n=1 Tax=Gluconobacter frateurii TaxID=38308 RepID=UPI001F058606|nr:hypothetical protein [Gluconobacter frateurii]UMM08407.1 hypothetical protein MKW11_14660 [Gluconobacter frateurii]